MSIAIFSVTLGPAAIDHAVASPIHPVTSPRRPHQDDNRRAAECCWAILSRCRSDSNPTESHIAPPACHRRAQKPNRSQPSTTNSIARFEFARCTRPRCRRRKQGSVKPRMFQGSGVGNVGARYATAPPYRSNRAVDTYPNPFGEAGSSCRDQAGSWGFRLVNDRRGLTDRSPSLPAPRRSTELDDIVRRIIDSTTG